MRSGDFFKSNPCDSSVQPVLRTTDLAFRSHCQISDPAVSALKHATGMLNEHCKRIWRMINLKATFKICHPFSKCQSHFDFRLPCLSSDYNNYDILRYFVITVRFKIMVNYIKVRYMVQHAGGRAQDWTPGGLESQSKSFSLSGPRCLIYKMKSLKETHFPPLDVFCAKMI